MAYRIRAIPYPSVIYDTVMGIDVAIVIVTYNSASVICGLLHSIPSALDGLSAKITVVDNGSTDETISRIADCNGDVDVDVIRSINRGYSAGINLGVDRMSEFDSILILNPDVVLGPRSVSLMLSSLQAETQTGIVVPMIIDSDGNLAMSLRREPRLTRAIGLEFTNIPLFSEMVRNPREYLNEHDVDWATGAVMLVSRECFERLGGWDESYFLYSEETDFCLRARDAGWKTVYQPLASAMHIAGGSGRSERTQAMQLLNAIRLYGRRHLPAGTWLFFAATVFIQLSRLARNQPGSLFVLKTLVNPRLRPDELGLTNSLLPCDARRNSKSTKI